MLQHIAAIMGSGGPESSANLPDFSRTYSHVGDPTSFSFTRSLSDYFRASTPISYSVTTTGGGVAASVADGVLTVSGNGAVTTTVTVTATAAGLSVEQSFLVRARFGKCYGVDEPPSATLSAYPNTDSALFHYTLHPDWDTSGGKTYPDTAYWEVDQGSGWEHAGFTATSGQHLGPDRYNYPALFRVRGRTHCLEPGIGPWSNTVTVPAP